MVTVSIIPDTRRIKLKTNKYPIKLRVTYERVTENYPTIIDLTEEDYEKFSASRISAALQDIRDKLKALERDAQTTVAKMALFQFSEFEKQFIPGQQLLKQKKEKPITQAFNPTSFNWEPFHKKFSMLKEGPFMEGTLGAAYLAYIRTLLMEGRIGTAASYHCGYASLKKFRGNPRFTDVTKGFLSEYENWLKDREVSNTTIGIYIRPMRTLFNEAIDNGALNREKHYPFGRRKYRIPTGKNVKKSLAIEDISKIYHHECETENEKKGKDFWVFCYFANEMNPKDIASLKYKNIDGEYLLFERAKTQHTMRSDPRTITVYVTEDMQRIIQLYGNKDTSGNNYLFPILERGQSPLRQYELIQLFSSFINDNMRRVMQELGLGKKATTYVARHTFSTVMKRSTRKHLHNKLAELAKDKLPTADLSFSGIWSAQSSWPNEAGLCLRYRQPSAGATCSRMADSTWTL